MKALTLSLTSFLFVFSCSPEKESADVDRSALLVEATQLENSSSTAGNLVADALRDVHNLDVVLYPSQFLREGSYALVEPGMDETAISQVLDLYPQGTQDQFMVGLMSGKDLKSFIFDRIQETYTTELQVSGLWYDIRFTGGIPTVKQFSRPWGKELDDQKRYRVAISNFFYFHGLVFPAYKYRNGITRIFKREGDEFISARAALKTYLAQLQEKPHLNEPRAQVQKHVIAESGFKSIPEIQGRSHISPLYGHRVTTRGVVTAAGIGEWYPRGLDLYIQNPSPDSHLETSEALHIGFTDEEQEVDIGNEIEVTGTVYEQMTSEGLSRTGLKDITSFKVLRQEVDLPPAVPLGKRGRKIPDQIISSYYGNVNLKEQLNINEALDFYESLEGMRISIDNPRVVGFRGGQEEFESTKPKSYLNLYVTPDGYAPDRSRTPDGGVIIDSEAQDFNPEVMRIWTHHLTEGLNSETVFNVGDTIDGRVTGVLGFEKNIFGGGEYAMLLPRSKENKASLMKHQEAKKGVQPTALKDRPRTKLLASPKHLTVASFNVENLAGFQQKRINMFAESISLNLGCPDIVNLVEIQDNDGPSFSSESAAEVTLERLTQSIDCSELPHPVSYRALNVDPIRNGEGGQPGGNIRVAMIYNEKRVDFTARPTNDPLLPALPDPSGNITPNPGRIFPEVEAFEHTRRSLVAQFSFQGEDIFVIGNHFNSKLGDSSRWGAQQPVVLDSDRRRIRLAQEVNEYIQVLQRLKPEAHILVVGDFNAYFLENPMKVLEGRHLKNLINFGNLVPPNERYTTNFNGNSQALDYIFAGHTLLSRSPELDIVHLNSDYMGRLSDHDPLVARFYMGPE